MLRSTRYRALTAATAALALGGATQAATLSLEAIDAGFYGDTGQHIPSIESVQTGQTVAQTNRHFTVFDLSTIPDTVVAATYEIDVPAASYDSPDASELLELFDVISPVAVLTAGPLPPAGEAVYDDLGEGTSYGSGSVSAAFDGGTFSLALNQAAIDAINLLLGLPPASQQFAIGGALTSILPVANVQTVFSGTSATSKRLVLTTVPEPGTGALLALGLLALVVRARRNGTRPALLAAALVLAFGAPVRAQNAFTEHDQDNYFRARGRQIYEAASTRYHQDFVAACADSQGQAAAQQLADLPAATVYGGVGQGTCWWSVGDAPHYFDVTPQRIHFIARTGAKLLGHIFTPQGPGPHPGVVITTGSIQASQQMYWFIARALVWAGYQVMTFDVQGQGQSETFAHDIGTVFPGTDGVPSQQNANFFDGTVDALRFFLSTPGAEYIPQGWTALEVATYKATTAHTDLNWSNPRFATLDHDNLGIAGHSLGASAVSGVQACSEEGTAYLTEPVCHGQSFPIRAVVAWDALSSGPPPVVPAMSQQADGYFLFPTFSTSAPDPNDSLGGYNNWRDEGLDTFLFVVRGGTHIEWSQVPYTSATLYGMHAAAYYTIAWMDRWVKQNPTARQKAYNALIGAPKSFPENPWSANHISARRHSAMSLRSPAHENAAAYDVDVVDLRAWAGRSAVGDFAGANADRYGRVIP